MFKLQRLEITGFKSFADYTEIVFTGNGITAVVGPNGCGKSNVSDSISWVLGEQRAKSLRGAEMKDVVFQGSRNRKPSGMAEVVLHMVRDEDAFDIEEEELEDIDEALSAIDDHAVDMDLIDPQEPLAADTPVDAVAETNGFHAEDAEVEKVQAAQVGIAKPVERQIKTKRHWRPRSFALDFAPGEAVSVTRRLYLSGESEYLLNGKTCRLRDIQDLFAGTGLSGAHYAIIEQGRIGQILSAKPSDRRGLIEEAAGISKFRTRQRAAESRLESAKSNLGRISDIVSEIDKQANSLRRQASKTRRFIALQEEFRVLLRELFAAEGKHLSALIDELEAKLANAIEIEKGFTSKVAEQEEAFRTATHNARASEEALTEIRRKHSENALERDRADREHRYQSEQIVNLTNRAEALKGEIESTTQRLSLIASEIARLEKDDEKESAEADASRAILQEAEKQYAVKVQDVRQIEADLENRRGELMRHTAAAERLSEVGRQLSTNLERLRERAEGLGRESVRADEAFKTHQAEARTTAENVAAERQKLDGLRKEKEAIQSVVAAAREAVRKAEQELKAVESEFSRTKNRFETLQELDERRAVYAPQIQKIFAEQSKIGVKFSGVLADFLNVEERAEKAVESLFGNYLQALIVESLADARKVSEWLRENRIGRVAMLVAPSDGLKSNGSAPGGSGSVIADVLGAPDGLRKALSQAFPQEMSARLVDDFDGSANNGAGAYVNLNGDLLIGGSLLVSGKEVTDKKNASLLAFKRELSGLEKSLAKLGKDVAKAQEQLESERKSLAEKEEKTVDLQSLIIKVELGLHGLEIQEKTVRQEIERAERHRKVVADETIQIEAEIVEIGNRIKEAEAQRNSAEEHRDMAQSALDEINRSLAEARARSEAENAVLNEKRTMAATSGERRRSVQSALQRVRNEQRDLETRMGQQKKEVEDIEGKTSDLRASITNISGRINSAESEIAAEQQELATAIAAVKTARESADATSEQLADLNRRSAEAMNERAAIEVRQTEAVTRLKNVQEKCVQELNIPLADVVAGEELGDDFSLEETRTKVEDLRERLEGFGAINMLAVEELAETEERLLFLTSQRQDIIDSIQSAEEALREIKERSRAKFKQAFEAINANFVQFFQELFGGGRGEMTLLESDDILEAGIEVVAQPPGKRLQNILLLSGGEKAMTAIALVLAIFKYRPSPFCLLDEVDAPLDEANVGRFVNKVAEMSEKTQFIVITHNKKTMEAARALYGVTMQEPGVSKIVSVKFD